MTIDNGHVSIRTGPRSNGRRWPGLINHIFFHWERHLPGEHGTRMHYMKKTSRGGSGMLWAMICWEVLGPAIHVDVTLTRTTYLNIVADHIHPFMEMVFPDVCGLFQQDNALCHKAKMAQEWFKEHNSTFEVLTCPPNSQDLSPSNHL